MNEFLSGMDILDGKKPEVPDTFPTPDINVKDFEFACETFQEYYDDEALPIPPKTQITVGMIEAEDVHTSWNPLTIKELDELSRLEKYILHVAIQKGTGYKGLEPTFYVTLPTVFFSYKKSKEGKGKNDHTGYMALYRAAKRLHDRGFADVKKADHGLIYIIFSKERLKALADGTRARIEADRERNFNLIRRYCEIPTDAEITDPGEKKRARPNPLDIPRNARYERLEAIRLVRGISDKHGMTVADLRDVTTLFTKYNDDVTKKIIALLDIDTGDLIGSEYSTRFNDPKKATLALKKFDYALKNSLEKYWYSCFLTLTTDPKNFPNLWAANRSLAEAWNKFLSWLTKRERKEGRGRPEYIVAYEYTKSGLIHLHAIMFMDWIADVEEISKEWQECGQGKIVYAYCLKRVKAKVPEWTKNGKRFVDGYEWRWRYPGKNNRPKKAKGSSGSDYIKAYMKKAALATTDRYDNPADIQALYWVFNKRFWSCSRRLLKGFSEPEVMSETDGEGKKEENGYTFFRVLSDVEAEDMGVRIVYNRGEGRRSKDEDTAISVLADECPQLEAGA